MTKATIAGGLNWIKQDEKHMEKIIGKVYLSSKESFDKCLVRLSI